MSPVSHYIVFSARYQARMVRWLMLKELQRRLVVALEHGAQF